MSFKSFDRFFVFVLALSTALYFFGAKPYPEESLNKAATSVSTEISNDSQMGRGSSIPPVGTETREEKTAEDDEPTDEDESAGHGESFENTYDNRTSALYCDEVVSQAQRAFHCPLHIRLRTILI